MNQRGIGFLEYKLVQLLQIKKLINVAIIKHEPATMNQRVDDFLRQP